MPARQKTVNFGPASAWAAGHPPRFAAANLAGQRRPATVVHRAEALACGPVGAERQAGGNGPGKQATSRNEATHLCGIAGYTGEYTSELAQAMCRRLRHRGPDDEGYYITPSIALTMRRLAIVDPHTGRQPICNETGDVWVVFNGEIYNHAAIRRSLQEQGHIFRTDHSDTEVVVHAYEQYGPKWPEAVGANGMFGLAIWDAKQELLLLYRDRLGKKPLYYAEIPSGVAFASEMKSLFLHPDVSTELDYGALYHYFGLKNVSAPRTAYRQIRQLPPGHFLTWRQGKGVTIPQPYWSPDFSPASPVPSEEEAATTILALLTDAVRLRMDCDVSYGAYLSGGMDSSAVAALMSKFQSRPVKTFCLGYADLDGGQATGKTQDLHFARIMAERLGSEHHEHIISSAEFASDLPAALSAFDEPFSGTISTFFLSAFMRRYITVAVSGDGADELFASYLSQRLAFPVAALDALRAKGGVSGELDPEERALLAPFDSGEALAFLMRIADSRLAVWRDRLSVFSQEELAGLLTPTFLDAARPDIGNPYAVIEPLLSGADPLNRSLEIDQRELLPNQILPFVDRLSMAHSIEVRCPFLDHRLVEFVNRLPGDYKIKAGLTKKILRTALKGLLPDDLLARPKEGFVQPVYTWMHNTLRQFFIDRIHDLPESLFRKSELEKIVAELQLGNPSVNAKVWNLVCFSFWINDASR